MQGRSVVLVACATLASWAESANTSWKQTRVILSGGGRDREGAGGGAGRGVIEYVYSPDKIELPTRETPSDCR